MYRYQAAVIIPTRGGAERLHYPLDALERQTEKDFQVIVVCDGDIDGSEEVLKEYRKREKLNLEVIVFPENRGRTRALNAGHYAADARVLIRCDDDLEPEIHFVQRHLELHRGSEETGVIGIYRNNFPPTPYSRAYGEYRDKLFRQSAYAAGEDFSWHYWAGNVSLTKKLFERVGGYDERYRLYGWEDVDMGYTVYQVGGRIVIDRQLETLHHAAATTTVSRAYRALHAGAARALFVQKHGSHVLPEARPAGVWGALVRLLATGATERSLRYYAGFADRTVDYLPRRLAEKLVALAVESAGYAGIKYPDRARKVF